MITFGVVDVYTTSHCVKCMIPDVLTELKWSWSAACGYRLTGAHCTSAIERTSLDKSLAVFWSHGQRVCRATAPALPWPLINHALSHARARQAGAWPLCGQAHDPWPGQRAPTNREAVAKASGLPAAKDEYDWTRFSTWWRTADLPRWPLHQAL